MVRVDYTCGTSMAVLSWDESLGRESFTAHVQSGNHTDVCHTTETHCSLTTLRCGSLYNLTVAAVAEHCNSSEAATQLHTGRNITPTTHTHLQFHFHTNTHTHSTISLYECNTFTR